jgi:hypothetical protein
MNEKTVYIIAAILGISFALLAGYYKLSPSRYILNTYGYSGLIIYGVIGISFFGILLYKLHATHKRINSDTNKENE